MIELMFVEIVAKALVLCLILFLVARRRARRILLVERFGDVALRVVLARFVIAGKFDDVVDLLRRFGGWARLRWRGVALI